MQDFSEKLKQTMINLKVNQVELPGRLGVSTATVNHYLQARRTPRVGDIDKMGKILGVDFFTNSEIKPSSESSVSFDILDLNGASLKQSDIQTYENLNEVFTVDRKWFIKAFGKEPTETMKIVFAGCESMTPTFNAGDFLLVDTAHTFIKDGVYVFTTESRLFIKRLQVLPDRIVAISDNNHYLTFDLPKKVHVVARVIDMWKHEIP